MKAVTILPMQANQGNPFQQADLFDPIEEVLEALDQSQLVIVTDDAQRENEGDLILAAEKATAEAISFMIRYTLDVICVAMEGTALDRLDLPLMTRRNSEAMRTAYTVSVDAKTGVTMPRSPHVAELFPSLMRVYRGFPPVAPLTRVA